MNSLREWRSRSKCIDFHDRKLEIQNNQMEKAARNNEYLAMIDRSIAQLESGKGQEHELIDVDE